MVAALLKETVMRRHYLEDVTVETIYFGGGTPSLLSVEETQSLIAAVKQQYSIAEGAEITLEANPDDISENKLQEWKMAGINRLSIGVQSFFEEDLRWMNRAHTSRQAIENLSLAKRYFDNITIDLIYGTPGLTDEKWESNVRTAVSLDIPHLSCYALTVEPKTPLDKMIRLHQSDNINPDHQSAQFLLLMHWLEAAGYEHYEISNFAKPGWRSRHNASYWQGIKYIGIGPSAHSYNGRERQWNIANNASYIRAMEEGTIPFEKEILTPVQQLNEYIMTALRTSAGINLDKIDEEENNILIQKSRKYIDSGIIRLENNTLLLTKEGKLLADGVAAELFF